MGNETDQVKTWKGNFGKEYTDRNLLNIEQMEELYIKNYGINRTEMNKEFIKDFNKSLKILEVGSNIGTQLSILQKMGFTNLYGIELQEYAVELSKKNTKNINIIQGSGFDIPYKDKFFDLVFTSGVLIHVSPKDIPLIIQEMHRCSKKYVWGFEYYADDHTEIIYRGEKNLLWKANFCKIIQDKFKDLKLVKEKKYKYLTNDNMDQMYLLEK